MSNSPAEPNSISITTGPREVRLFHVKVFFDHEHIRAGCNSRFIQALKDAGFGEKECKVRSLHMIPERNLGVVLFNIPVSARPKLLYIINGVNASFCKKNALVTPYHSISTHKMINGVLAPGATETAFYCEPAVREMFETPPKKSTPTRSSMGAVRKVTKTRSRINNERLPGTPIMQTKKPILTPFHPQKRARFLDSDIEAIGKFELE